MSTPVLTAVAWPYANGPRHIGHVSGIRSPVRRLLPLHADGRQRVLMVSGTDEHGTPIPVQADKEASTPQQTADKYTPRRSPTTCRASACPTTCSPGPPPATTPRSRSRSSWRCTATATSCRRPREGAISPSTGRTLPDRYIEGTCPICGYDGARGDQCDNCGNQLDADRPDQPEVADQRRDAEVRRDRAPIPRPARVHQDAGQLAGHQDRLAARTSCNSPRTCWTTCGPGRSPATSTGACQIPLDGWRDQPLKRFYVWFDAVIGYFSASVEWARRSGDPDAWQEWWNDPDARIVLLHGQGQHHLPRPDLAGAAARPQRRGRPRAASPGSTAR